MTKVSFLALTGCYFSGINYLIDAFSIVEQWHQYKTGDYDIRLFEMEIVTEDGKPVSANGGIKIEPQGRLNDLEDTDMLLIPGIQNLTSPFIKNQENVMECLVGMHSQGMLVGAGCTGVFLLAQSGLLDGKAATTNWRFAKAFARQFPKVDLRIDQILTEEDNLVCTGATSSALNLVLYVLRRYCSEEIALQGAKMLLIDPGRESQSPYMNLSHSPEHGDDEIAKAQQWMKANYANNVSIDEIAEFVNLSSRHFKRRFKKATGDSPLHYLQTIRIEAGKKRLEMTKDTVNEITYQIGYEDSSTFRRLFKKQVGLTPKEYRDKFLVS